MTNKLLILLFFFSPIYADAQVSVKKFPLIRNSSISVSIHKDSGFLVTTLGSDRFLWITADLKKFGAKILQSQFNLFTCATTSTKNGLYLTGLLYPKNSTHSSPSWLMVAKLDLCLEPVWQKKILVQEKYLDTTIVNTELFIVGITLDDNENLYFFTTNENTKMTKTQPEINRNTGYVYKFNSYGDLLFRKPILNRMHTNLSLYDTYYHQGKIYFAGDAYFPQFGVKDTNFSLLFLRGVVGSIDTSGTIIQTKIFEEDAYFSNGGSNVFVQKDDSIIICAIYGTHVIQPGYDESQEFILDNNFKTIKSIKSTEKDSVFSYARVIDKSPTNGLTCFKKYQLMSQKGDVFSRTNYGYLIHYDENMKVKDSSAIDFFYPSNINNNYYNVYALVNNPLNDSLVTFFGSSNQNSSNPYFYAVNVNRNGHAVDSIHIPRYPQLACELKYDVSTIFFNSFDTITITTDYHQRYNDPVTEVKELVMPDTILMTPYPNPAHKNLCFEYFNLIDKVGLFTMQGTQIEDLKQDGNCFVLPENFQEGIYYVKITMKNSTIHYSRVKLLRY